MCYVRLYCRAVCGVYTEGGQRAAHINMWTSSMLSFEGSNAVLFCRADGNPAPTITWFDREDRHIESSADHNQYLASSALHSMQLKGSVEEPFNVVLYAISLVHWIRFDEFYRNICSSK